MVRTIVASVVVLFVVGAAVGVAPREVADEDVDFVIGEIKRFLYDQQGANGEWTPRRSQGQRGGTTGLALLALLEAGESPQDPRMKNGLDALVTIESDNLYVRAVRVMALSQVVARWKDSPYREPLENDVRWLTQGAIARGAWGYKGPERTGDNSCSQFALLALWEAYRAGVKMNPAMFRGVINAAERTWLRRQRKDGGWTYAGIPGIESASTLTMTTAGLASLYICQDVLTTADGAYRHQKAMNAAWAYLARDLKENYIGNGYLGFCVQRVGMASGRKFIGEMDWYAAGAAKLCQPTPKGRGYGGRWWRIVRASFELLFLARGRIPMTFNKLRHGPDNTWNYHPRDLAHFTEYMRRNFERRMRWQIVPITDDVQMLLCAPILFVTGTKALEFTPEQWDKLREYTLRGGTLLFVPIHRNKAFLESVREGLEDLYAEQRELAGGYYTLEPLRSTHPVYSVHQKIANGARIAPMHGVSDGTRLLAVICDRNLGHSWGKPTPTTSSIDHMLGANLFLYATGANRLATRLRPVFVTREGPAKIKHHVKIAWLKHDGNWCTQPYALSYLSEKLTAENRIAIELTKGVPPEADKLKGRHLVWVTGSEGFSLSDEAIAALRQYIADGGTIFVNAVGGSRSFNGSAREMLDKLLPPGEAVMGDVGDDSPLITGKIGDFRGPAITRPERTNALRKIARRGPPLKVYLRDGRIVAMYARYGIHDTLDGHTSHEALSFMPSSARDLAANIVLYSLLENPEGSL